MKTILDSSYVIALCKRDDPQHNKAVSYLLENQIKSGDLLCSSFIYAEIVTVATYKNIPLIDITNFFEKFGVVFFETPIRNYINYSTTIGKRISIADVSVLYDAQIYNADRILTYDDQLQHIFDSLI